MIPPHFLTCGPALNDPAARFAGSSYYIYELLKTSSGVSQEIWMMDAARFAGPSYYMPSG
jgi:cytochrome c551/c552